MRNINARTWRFGVIALPLSNANYKVVSLEYTAVWVRKKKTNNASSGLGQCQLIKQYGMDVACVAAELYRGLVRLQRRLARMESACVLRVCKLECLKGDQL